MTARYRKVLWIAVALLLITVVSAVLWLRRFHGYTPIEVTQDIRAAIAAKNAPKPVERFLELRYGPLTEPANRQRAFLDFFNAGHIEGLQIIVRHTPESMKQANTEAMARWVAEYRQTMTPAEKQSLGEIFNSDAGRSKLQQATAKYLQQDVYYRAHTAPVITELMTTVAAVQKP